MTLLPDIYGCRGLNLVGLPLNPLSLDPLVSRDSALPDSGVPPSAIEDQIIQEAVNKYKKMPFGVDLDWIDDIPSIHDMDTGGLVLSPPQLEMAYNRLIDRVENNNLNDEVLGVYITRLIQDSFNYGKYNNFMLHQTHICSQNLGNELQGHKNKKVNLNIEGDLYYASCEDCVNTRITVFGDTHTWFGTNGGYSIFEIHGKAGFFCGWGAYKSIFTLHSSAGSSCGNNAADCIFNIYNKSLYERLKDELDKSNKVNLLDSHNQIIEKRSKR